jgi:hypothetical protein
MRLRALAAAAVLAIAAPAFAQTDQQTNQPAPEQGQHPGVSPEARAAMRKACAADIQTYCSDSGNGGDGGNGGGRRLGQCLRQNFDKLSGDCQTQLKAMRSNWRRQDQQPQEPQ